jgi:hypothetical protein
MMSLIPRLVMADEEGHRREADLQLTSGMFGFGQQALFNEKVGGPSVAKPLTMLRLGSSSRGLREREREKAGVARGREGARERETHMRL